MPGSIAVRGFNPPNLPPPLISNTGPGFCLYSDVVLPVFPVMTIRIFIETVASAQPHSPIISLQVG